MRISSGAFYGVFLGIVLFLAVGIVGQGQRLEPQTGQAFEDAAIDSFYLEGLAIPVQKRNTVLLKKGEMRVLVGLLDTSGYSTDIQQKYIGMFITEGDLEVGGQKLSMGSYGFGLQTGEGQEGALLLYDLAGRKAGQAPVAHDQELRGPRPLQVIADQDRPARLYLGRHWVELK
jgi:hypothetical protein